MFLNITVVDLYSAKSTCNCCSGAIDINIIIKAAVDDDDDCFSIALFSLSSRLTALACDST